MNLHERMKTSTQLQVLSHVLRLQGIALTLGLLAAACKKDPIEQACRSGYAVVYCKGDILEEELFEAHVDDCLALNQEAAGRSGACQDAHTELLDCIGNLTCEGSNSWRADECGATPGHACGLEGAAFCELCPGIWVAPE
jgi:hypothetical protein